MSIYLAMNYAAYECESFMVAFHSIEGAKSLIEKDYADYRDMMGWEGGGTSLTWISEKDGVWYADKYPNDGSRADGYYVDGYVIRRVEVKP